jgi:Pyruvate/2-oxoacid:ferredoxin oxidoreductase gamma subunit/ferredoxin
VSHLRFGPRPIHAPYLVEQAGFVACHQFDLMDKMDVVGRAAPGAVLLLNAAGAPETVWGRLSGDVQRQILAKGLQVYAIDAGRVAREAGLGGRINTIMQVCFFALSGVLPAQEAAERIKEAAAKSYGRRGLELVRRNAAAVDASLACLHRVELPAIASDEPSRPLVSAAAPEFVRRVSAVMMSGRGDLLPVSAFPPDGTWPVATSQWEKRNIAASIPVWDPQVCIQCNQCVLACPHAAIRAKRYAPAHLEGAPRRVPVDGLPLARGGGRAVHAAGGARGLHGLRALRGRVPGQGPAEPAAQGDRHGTAAAAPGGRARELRVLPGAARAGTPRREAPRREGVAVPPPVVRVLRRLRRLRRDAVRQAADAALRRPRAHRERDRLLVDLRRQPAHDARTPPTLAAAVPPGRTRSSRTTRSSGSASAWRSTPAGGRRRRSWARSAPRSAWTRRGCSPPTSRTRAASRRSARGWRT